MMNKSLRISLKIFIVLLVVLIGVAIALPFIIDPNDYKGQIIELVKKNTGRQLDIPGDIKLSVFPWLGVELGAVSLGNAQGFGTDPMLRLESMDVRVQLLPLLQGKVRLGHVTLRGLDLKLARNKDGLTNWGDLIKPKPGTQPPGTPAEKSPTETLPRGAPLAALALEGMTLSNARINWQDDTRDQHYTLHDLNLTVGAIAPDHPFPLEAEMQYVSTSPKASGKLMLSTSLTLDATLQRFAIRDLDISNHLVTENLPDNELDSRLRAAQFNLALDKQTLTAREFQFQVQDLSLSGKIDAKAILTHPAYQASLTVSPFSPRKLMTTFGIAVPKTTDPKALGQAGLSVTLNGTDDLLDISRLQIKLDDSTLSGKLAVKHFQKPVLRYTLALDAIDADRYLPPPSNKHATREETRTGLIPVVQTAATRQSPSAILEALDIDGKLTIGQLKIMNLQSRNLVLPLHASGGHIKLAPLSADLIDKQSGLQLSLQKASLAGKLDAEKLLVNPTYRASLSTNPFSLRKALHAIGISPPNTADPEALSRTELSLQLDGTGKQAAISKLHLRLDDSTLSGTLAVKNFKQPALRYDLALDRINADRYLPPTPNKTSAGTKPIATPGAAAGAATQLPMNTLRALDVEGRLAIGQLKIMNLRSTKIVVPVKARRGLIKLAPLSAKLYGGQYKGHIQLDVTSQKPKLALDEALQQVQIGPLLKDFQGDDRITGTANLQAKLTARGVDAIALRKTLSGSGKFAFANGVVKGFNLAQIERNLNALLKGKPAPRSREPEQTDFSSITGSFRITNGLLRNNDLHAALPHARVIGNGNANLANEELDYTLNVKFTSEVAGQSGTRYEQMDKVALPIRITGNFSQPRFEPDYQAVVQDLARRELKKQEKALKDKLNKELEKKAGDLFKGLLNR
jgi:AsmA protein